MPILTTSEALAHCRLEADYPAEQILPYMLAAEDFVVAYLNRAVYVDQDALDTAQASLAETVGTAYDAYLSAIEAAEAQENAGQREIMCALAKEKYMTAKRKANRAMLGVVVNPTIRAAMLLTLGNLFVNRETDVVGVSVAKLPSGVPELLRPYRVVQMP